MKQQWWMALPLAVSACGQPIGPADAPVAGKAPLLSFTAHADPVAGTIRIAVDGVRGLQPLNVVQNGTPGSGPAGSVELVTLSTGECAGPGTWGGSVQLNSFYAQTLTNLAVQVTSISPVVGYDPVNPDALPPLDNSLGLWTYPGGSGSSETWCFNVAGGNFTFGGRVWGDLPAGPVNNVLVVFGNSSPTFADCVVSGLQPHFASVTGQADTPTPAQLATVDAVLAYQNGDFNDAVGLGDAMADYHDAGGRVVEGLYGTGNLGRMTGRWATDGYSLYTGGTWDGSAVSIGTVFEPASPLMTGVNTFSTIRHSTGAAAPGATVVAAYSDGTPMIVRGTVGGRPRVDLGMFPGGCDGGNFTYWQGDGFEMIRNALQF